MRPEPGPPGERPDAGFDPSPFRGMGEPERQPTALERVQAIRERNRLSLGRLSAVLGLVGVLVGVLAVTTLVNPNSPLLPRPTEPEAAGMSPAARHALGLGAAAVEALLGLVGLVLGLRALPGVTGAARVLGRAGIAANLIALGAAVALFLMS